MQKEDCTNHLKAVEAGCLRNAFRIPTAKHASKSGVNINRRLRVGKEGMLAIISAAAAGGSNA